MSEESSKRPQSGFPPGNIGDLSIRLGQDVRELIMDGVTWAEIYQMIAEREAKQQKSNSDENP